MHGRLDSSMSHWPSRRLALLAAGAVWLLGCPAPQTRPAAPAPPRSAPAVSVLYRYQANEGFLQLLGVDRARGEVQLLVRAFASQTPRPPVRLVSVPLTAGRSVRRWVLPRPASALIDQGLLFDVPQAQGSTWLPRLAGVLHRLGPWYVWRHPPVLALSPQGDRFVYAETADKRALVGLAGGPPRPLNGRSPACYRTAFSPDGRWIGYVCFSRRHKTYCPTLLSLSDTPGSPPPKPRQHCTVRGGAVSGPYWQPDSSAFLTLLRRGFGAYSDTVHRVCLTRTEVPGGQARALWCRDLEQDGDRKRTFLFRPAPDGKTGVVLESDGIVRSCRVTARLLRLSDGGQLAAWRGVPTSLAYPPFAVLDARRRLLLQACDDSILAVDLTTGAARSYLHGRRVTGIAGPAGDRLIALEQRREQRYRVLRLDLARAPAKQLPALKPL